ncbi:MAG: hypothetical protein HYR83_02245 [Planctomycetes bacterium]|nr:hypothetical protein [Planctomycetota bacterium]
MTVSLVPSHPPPFYTGEQITINVYLESNVNYELWFDAMQLDFTHSVPVISLGPTFTFDYPGVDPVFNNWSSLKNSLLSTECRTSGS